MSTMVADEEHDDKAPLLCDSDGDQRGVLTTTTIGTGEDRVPGCMKWLSHGCGAAWHYSTMPLHYMLTVFWGSRPQDSGSDDEGGGIVYGDTTPQARRPSMVDTLDQKSSPLYRSFHPGDGYDALSPPPPLPVTQRGASTAGDAPLASGAAEPLRTPLMSSREPALVHSTSMPSITPVPELPALLPVSHTPIYTVHEMEKRIAALQQWLPISVRLSSAPVERTASRSHDSGETVPESTLQVALCGPIKRPAAVVAYQSRGASFPVGDVPTLSDVEDFICEDACGILLSAVHLVDINVSAKAYEHEDLATLRRQTSSPGAPLFESTDGDDPYEIVVARVLGMFQNLMIFVSDRKGIPRGLGLRVSVTRCQFAPSDLLDALRLPLFIESLQFLQCPMSDAHIAVLLRRARQDDGFWSHMRFLQLSGTLSSDAVRALLRFLDEEVEQPVLTELVVPNGCAAAASGHPILIRLPHLSVNGKSIRRQVAGS